MRNNWTLLVLNKVEERLKYNANLLMDCNNYVQNVYIGKSKDIYINNLNKIIIPNIVCIDNINKCISYKINGVIFERKGKIGRLSTIPMHHNRIDSYTLTSITALMSGKKQEACALTAVKRRLVDGSYHGIRQSMNTMRANNTLLARHVKIAKNRRENDTYNSPLKNDIVELQKITKEIAHGYELLYQEYIHNKSKMIFKCNKGHLFKMHWNGFLSSRYRCQKCRVFKQQEGCRKVFERLFNLPFLSIRPKWLVNPNTNTRLELDGYNESVKIAFEYDGELHYRSIDFFGGDKVLLGYQERDKIKDELCEKNGVRLIRIPYFIPYKEREGYIIKELTSRGLL